VLDEASPDAAALGDAASESAVERALELGGETSVASRSMVGGGTRRRGCGSSVVFSFSSAIE
jgi:hypothetical protein